MKRPFCISLSIFLLLHFIFYSTIFAGNTTVSIDICEISINCGENGSFSIDGEKYSGAKSFFRRAGDTVTINLEPRSRYKLGRITCDTEDTIIVGTNCITINNIQNNMNIEFKFEKRGASGTVVKDDSELQKCDGGEKCPVNHFVDVNTAEWYHEDLDYVFLKGLMNGVSKNQFEPHSPTTRAMIVTILYRLEGSPVVNGSNIFSDVEENMWYTDAIIWASANNIVLGYGGNIFGTTDDVTREQMVTLIYRYAKYKNYDIESNRNSNIAEFSDVDKVNDWAYESMEWACREEIIKGSENMIMPQNSTERCQIAAILHRFCKNIVK